MDIPFFSTSQSYSRYAPSISRRIDLIISSGVFSNGKTVKELEQSLASFTGARHVICVSNGTDALILMLIAAGIGPGDEVIVPAFTFVSTATSVIHVGATPVFVDIEPRSYALDTNDFLRKIGSRTRAVMPVHLFRQPADMHRINEIARSNGIAVLEDSAEGIGMRVCGGHTGTLGVAGNLSFFPTKTLGCFGDGGAILTGDGLLAEKIRLLRDQGRSEIDSVARIHGYNARMDEIQAAVLLARLDFLDKEIMARRSLSRYYDDRLSQLSPHIRIPTDVDRGYATESVVYVYQIEAQSRDLLAQHLSRSGIATEIYYPRPLPEQPCFSRLADCSVPFPVSKNVCEHALALPFYPDLTTAEADAVCMAIESFYQEIA